MDAYKTSNIVNLRVLKNKILAPKFNFFADMGDQKTGNDHIELLVA